MFCYRYHRCICFLIIGRLKELKTGIMEIQRKEPKLQLLLDKMQDKTNECSDEMAEVIKSVQNAKQLAATADNVVSVSRDT